MNPGRPAKSRFPWRNGHRYRLLVDGDAFYPAMLESIAGARRYVLMEMYLFESGRVADRFIAALTAAASRGVQACLLLDDFGALQLRRRDRQRLADGGVRLAFFNPLRTRSWRGNLRRDHRKLLLVDGEVAYTGGAGVTDHFDPREHPGRFWHEVMLETRGPCVADWLVLFRETWQRARQGGEGELALPVPALQMEGGQPGRVAPHGAPPRRSQIMVSFVRHIRHAERRAWLATAYFLPSWKIRRALRRAARRGVDVRLLLPGPHTDHPSVRHIGCRHYERLLRAGVRIFEYQPRFLHAKLVLCDDWLSIGSSNLDRWNHRWNLEGNQELTAPTILHRACRLFTDDFARSREIDYAQWRRRPWYRRQMEWFWGWVETLVTRLSIRRRRHRRPRQK